MGGGGKRDQPKSSASPSIAHRSNLGIQLFSLKAPNEIPKPEQFFFMGMRQCGLLPENVNGWGWEKGANPNPLPRPALHIDPTSGSNFSRLRFRTPLEKTRAH